MLPFNQLVELLAPDDVDYGKMPRSLSDQFVELSKNIADTVKNAAQK